MMFQVSKVLCIFSAFHGILNLDSLHLLFYVLKSSVDSDVSVRCSL